MEKIINDFRLLWTDTGWSLVKLTILTFVVYNVFYHIGKAWVNIFG